MLSEDQKREDYLQHYFDRMGDLLLKENLKESSSQDSVRQLARTFTLSTLRVLDGERKALLLRFLIEERLIQRLDPIVSLKGADLRDAVVAEFNDNYYPMLGIGNRVEMQGINLSQVDLSGAKLCECNLMESDLSEVIFLNTNLNGANLSKSNLEKARFEGANIGGVKFNDACLYNAKFIKITSGLNRFINTNLEQSYFCNVFIYDYDFYGSNLWQVRIEGGNFDEELRRKVNEFPTSWPPRQKPY